MYICMVVVLLSESKYFGLLSKIDLLSRALESFMPCDTSQAPENNCCSSFIWVEEPEQFVHYDEQQCLGVLTCKKYSLANLVSPKLEEQFSLGLAWQRLVYRIQKISLDHCRTLKYLRIGGETIFQNIEWKRYINQELLTKQNFAPSPWGGP